MSDHSIAVQVVTFIHREGMPVGSHLPAQMIADCLRISRSPVNEALALLYQKGVLTRQPNRGFFLARSMDEPLEHIVDQLGLSKCDAATSAYFRIADDRLKGVLPEEVSEQLLKTRYTLTASQLNIVLSRIGREGWAQRKSGYGWQFLPMLTTSDSLLKSYRLRIALEPAALLEPGYRLEKKVLARCRADELQLLQGGIEIATADQMHDRGVRFHEALVEASGNSFMIDAIKRVNHVRRLLSYRSMQDRQRYAEHCKHHLHILDLLEKRENQAASEALAAHLRHTLTALSKLSGIFKP